MKNEYQYYGQHDQLPGEADRKLFGPSGLPLWKQEGQQWPLEASPSPSSTSTICVKEEDLQYHDLEHGSPAKPRLHHTVLYPPLHSSHSRLLSSKTQYRSYTNNPSNHYLVPQGVVPNLKSDTGCPYPPVEFKKRHCPEIGFTTVDDLASGEYGLENAAKDWMGTTGEVRIYILWPGYRPYYFKVNPHVGKSNLGIAQMLQSRVSGDFIEKLESDEPVKKKSRNDRGDKTWKISTRRGDAGIAISKVVMTRLVHRGGCQWQLELWVPKVSS